MIKKKEKKHKCTSWPKRYVTPFPQNLALYRYIDRYVVSKDLKHFDPCKLAVTKCYRSKKCYQP